MISIPLVTDIPRISSETPQTVDNAETNVAWGKNVNPVHVLKARGIPFVTEIPLTYPMIPPIADSAETSVPLDKDVNTAHVLKEQAIHTVMAWA